MEKQDKIKQILGNIENTEIFLEESNFIQKPSYDEILNCLKNSKEIVYKKININNFKEEIEKIPDMKAVFCVVKGNDYSALSEITEPLSRIHSILEEKNIVFFGWGIYEKTENYKAAEDVYSLIVK